MPEGDTIAGHARMLEPVLVGRRVIAVGGTSPAVRARSARILDAEVEAIRTVGKHLIIDLDNDYSIRVHLGMTGRWQVGEKSRPPHGSARLVLSTDQHHAVCYAAPTIEVERKSVVDAAVSHLGPDLLDSFDEEAFSKRARNRAGSRIADVLIDQRVVAGLGNVYKSELLFMEGIHPDTPVGDIPEERLLALARRARRQLAANVGRVRSTTGVRAPKRDSWVYGRSGLPCRRCGTAITQEERSARLTYWCPACQPRLG